jgi:hypothetical protein
MQKAVNRRSFLSRISSAVAALAMAPVLCRNVSKSDKARALLRKYMEISGQSRSVNEAIDRSFLRTAFSNNFAGAIPTVAMPSNRQSAQQSNSSLRRVQTS